MRQQLSIEEESRRLEVKEIASDLKGTFRLTPKDEVPPCILCSDEQIARCTESGYECFDYKHFVRAAIKKSKF